MASCSKKLKIRRKLSKASAGKARKNKIRREGSTLPNLPLTVPNANERAQQSKNK